MTSHLYSAELILAGTVGLGLCFIACGNRTDSSAPKTHPVASPNLESEAVKDVTSVKNTILLPAIESPAPLPVTGFFDASHVGPSVRDEGAKPVVVVLHGNFDRPEWQCDMWKDAASWYGWILCPRGVRTTAATLREDRWTYKGGAVAVHREMMAALEALEQRYPNAVSRNGMVLVGFSLGAILAPEVIRMSGNLFKTVFFVEGGIKQLEWSLSSMKKAGISAIGLAMSTHQNREGALKLEKKILQNKYVYAFVDMRGAGHNYRNDFRETGLEAMKALLGDNGKDE